MRLRLDIFSTSIRRLFLLVGLGFALTACAMAPAPTGISDPYEGQNRAIHGFNKAVDRTLLKPTASTYKSVAPGLVRTGINNVAANLSLPGIVLNDLLQLKLGAAFHNTTRFALNSTFGLAGLLDVATQNKLPGLPNDFGQTLYVWGVPEGAYTVDFAVNPTKYLLQPGQRQLGTAAKLLEKLDDRNKYAGLVDSVLYGSDDSYAQSRLLYLQSRRRELSGELNESQLEDPYAN
jgi:phospholipid-binding lipoprotein MlaA